MSRVTVVPSDNVVVVDGVSKVVDCSNVPKFIHAIQWDGVRGHIEFVPIDNVHQGNLAITSFDQFSYLLDFHAHAVAKEKRDAEAKSLKLIQDKVKDAEALRTQKREFDAAMKAAAVEQKKLDEEAAKFKADVVALMDAHANDKKRIEDLTKRLEALEKGE